MTNCNILDPNSEAEHLIDARVLAELSDLRIRIARLEAQLAAPPTPCCETDRPESCGCQTCPDARRFDQLERLHEDLIAEADPFGIGPAGTVPSLSEAFDFPPPPHIGIRRATRMLEDQERQTLSYADHARANTSLDGGAA